MIEKQLPWQKEVVVLIPNYNRPAELRRCLESLRKNTPNARYDLLIVDDCSPMETEVSAVINSYLPTQSNWMLIKTPTNGGFTKCVNWGINFLWSVPTDYKFIVLLNNDAVVGPGWLQAMVNAFDDPMPVGVTAPFKAVWCPDSIYATPIGQDRPYLPDRHPVEARTQMCVDLQCDEWYEEHVGFWGVMIRLELFKKYGLFEEQFQVICQDLDWCRRISKYGWKIKVLLKDKGHNHHIYHNGNTHQDLKPHDEIRPLVEEDERLIRDFWPEKYR